MLSHWEFIQQSRPFDVLIIGSGITGCSAAIHMKKKDPMLRIGILESERLFMTTASTKNAGFACFGSLSELLEDEESLGTEAMLALVERRWKGLQALRNLIPDESMDFISCGGHEVFEDKSLFEQCESERDRFNEMLKEIIGPKVFRMEKKGSDFGFKGFSGMISNSYESQLDPARMMAGFHGEMRRLDIPVFMGSRVERLEENEGHVEVILDEGILKAKQVLVGTNGLSKKLLDLDVKPTRAQVLITEPVVGLDWQGVFHLDHGYTYFRNVGNRVLLGGKRNLDMEKEYDSGMELNPLIQNALEELLREKILPDSGVKIERRWAGIMGTGSSRDPILQSTSARIHCAVRLGGMGVAIGTALGRDAASLVLRGV